MEAPKIRNPGRRAALRASSAERGRQDPRRSRRGREEANSISDLKGAYVPGSRCVRGNAPNPGQRKTYGTAPPPPPYPSCRPRQGQVLGLASQKTLWCCGGGGRGGVKRAATSMPRAEGISFGTGYAAVSADASPSLLPGGSRAWGPPGHPLSAVPQHPGGINAAPKAGGL